MSPVRSRSFPSTLASSCGMDRGVPRASQTESHGKAGQGQHGMQVAWDYAIDCGGLLVYSHGWHECDVDGARVKMERT